MKFEILKKKLNLTVGNLFFSFFMILNYLDKTNMNFELLHFENLSVTISKSELLIVFLLLNI